MLQAFIHQLGINSAVIKAMVLCTCPGCFGNAPSCTYDTNGKCPTIDIPVANAAAVAGVATAVAAGLTLTNVISARFLRIFSRAHLQAVMHHGARAGAADSLSGDQALTSAVSPLSREGSRADSRSCQPTMNERNTRRADSR